MSGCTVQAEAPQGTHMRQALKQYLKESLPLTSLTECVFTGLVVTSAAILAEGRLSLHPCLIHIFLKEQRAAKLHVNDNNGGLELSAPDRAIEDRENSDHAIRCLLSRGVG